MDADTGFKEVFALFARHTWIWTGIARDWVKVKSRERPR